MRYINDSYGRAGALLEGPYRSHLVASTEHLLRCYRYIEFNPVRAGMVSHAGDHRWSSYGCNAMDHADPLIQPRVRYCRLNNAEGQQLQMYRGLVQQACNEDAVHFSDRLCHHPQIGNDRFWLAIEAQADRGLAMAISSRSKK